MPRWYAVDAYLWAEQYGWMAYDDSPLRSPVLIEEYASFYFAHDLRWYAELLAAVADCVGSMVRIDDSSGREKTLQAWHNWFSQSGRSPKCWLEGKRVLQSAKARNSLRVSAAKVNKKRREVFEYWVPSWRAELEHLQGQLRKAGLRG